MRAEFARDAVEIMVGRFVAVELACHVFVRAVEFAHPRTFDCLDRVRQHHRPNVARFFFDKALFHAEFAFGHFLARLIARPRQFYRFFKAFCAIVNEIDRAFAVS